MELSSRVEPSRAGAALALSYSIGLTWCPVLGVVASIDRGDYWFGVGVAASVLISLLSGTYVAAYLGPPGRKQNHLVIESRGYLRHYSALLGVDWRPVAAVAWSALGLLGAGWLFLVIHAVWDLALR